MGTWDVGPFDNDTAADWCGDLHEAAPDQRPELIRQALAAVVACGGGYLDRDLADEALAAAAVIASQRPGATPVTSSYAPDFLLAGGTLDLPDGHRTLAVQALTRILAEESEWRELWEDTDQYPEAAAEIHRLRAALTG